jgi:hypothetical protein
VLIGVIELGEPDKFTPSPYPTSVWLEWRQNRPNAVANTRQSPTLAHGVEVFTVSPTERELDLFFLGFGEAAPSLTEEFPSQVVEGGTEVIEGITRHKSPPLFRGIGRYDPEPDLVLLRVELSPEADGGIGFGVSPQSDFSLDSFGVILTPLPLRKRTRKVKAASHGA